MVGKTGLFVSICFFFGSGFVHGQEFDEKFEHWPTKLKINGTIIAHNQLSDLKLLERAILRFQNRANSNNQDAETEKKVELNAIQLGFGEPASTKNGLEELSFHWVHDPVFVGKVKPDEIQSALNGVQIVFLNGQSLIPARVDSARVLAPILESFLAKDGILVADSTATKWLSSLVVSNEGIIPETTVGMGLIPDSVIETNFQNGEAERRVRCVLAAHPLKVGIGIRPNTCLVFRGRKVFAFEKGEAHFMLAANERQPQRNHLIGADRKPASRLDFEFNLVDLTEWRRDAIDRTLPAFPPKNPEKPFVENGSLVIVGGGGMPSNLMEEIVKLAGGNDARMVYVPCSERDEVREPKRLIESWKKMGVASATYIHTKDRKKANSDSEFLAPLKEATGIWFGGGRQWNFADSYYGTKAHKLMKEVLKRGGVIGGSSAGASIQARYLARATPIANYRIMAPGYERGGLGFISGVAIDQHFSQRGRQKDMTQLMATHPQLLGIGIDETTAIIVNKNVAKVVGKGKVHFYDRNQPVYPDRPDYVALAKGSVYDLKNRKILIDANAAESADETPSKSKSGTGRPEENR